MGWCKLSAEKIWSELTPDEKREERFKRWLSPDVKFKSPQAEKDYKERVTRFTRAFQLKEADRVPCIVPAGNFAAYYSGTDLRTVMYDYDELKRAWRKFLYEFGDSDMFFGPGMIPPGKALEAVDYKLYKWPGRGISGDTTSYQCVEGEYMKADEYDALIKDPSNFWLRTYLPRVFGAFEPFRNIPPFTTIEEIAIMSFVPYGMPDVQAAFEALLEAGRESMKWMSAVMEVSQEAMELGYPPVMAGLAKAPFDTIGDTLRGTRAIMMDMFQRPDKLQEAMEKITLLTTDSAISSVGESSPPIVMMPLHKGADGFMSEKQYETFYWPTFKKVIMNLVNEGILPILFAEGGYNTRLDIIKELPKASVAWWFDKTDMARAKKVLGDKACIMGNVPTSLLSTGTPEEIKEHCRKLIEACGKGGGYVLAGGANIDKGNPDNLRAMMEAAKEYGVYK
jgi:uroporphyrinogen-III decarboxylase